MTGRTRDSQRSKAAILAAAQRLFAEQDFTAVSIRDVAAEAGVSHGLVQHHFGTRERLVAAIIAEEIATFRDRNGTAPSVSTAADREQLRREFRTGQQHFRQFAQLITRAELAGAAPERMLHDGDPNPTSLLAEAIRVQQQDRGASDLDPAIVAAYITAALFAFSTVGPFLMAAVGLQPEDLDGRSEDIAAISMALVTLATGGTQPSED